MTSPSAQNIRPGTEDLQITERLMLTIDRNRTRREPGKTLERIFRFDFHDQPLPREHLSEFSLKHQTWPGDIPALEAREEWFHSDRDTMSYCELRALWDRSGATGTLNWERRWQNWPRTLVNLMISQSGGGGLNLNRRLLTATHIYTQMCIYIYLKFMTLLGLACGPHEGKNYLKY